MHKSERGVCHPRGACRSSNLSRSRNGPALNPTADSRDRLWAWPGRVSPSASPLAAPPPPAGQPCLGSGQFSRASSLASPHRLSDRPSQSCKWQVAALGARGGVARGHFPGPPHPGARAPRKTATGLPPLASPTAMLKSGQKGGKNNFHPVRHFIKKISQEIGCYLQITTGLLANSWGQSQGQLQLQLSSH